MADRFELNSPYAPAGDQPEAIARLIEGIEDGFSRQTLLGVTGSGKSIGYDDPLFITEACSGELRSKVVPAGPFIDALLETHGLSSGANETERFACTDRTFFTQAFDPARGETATCPVAAFLRHRTPAEMFRMRTACGREATLTGDHNLWVLRQGELRLIRTEDIGLDDYLPVPETLAGSEDLQTLDVLPYLTDTTLSVFAEAPIVEYVAVAGRAQFLAAMQACVISPDQKLWAIRRKVRGSGLKVRHFLTLMSHTHKLGGLCGARVAVGGKKAACRLPARLPLSPSVLSLFGYYVAEGNSQSRFLVLSNHHPVLRARIERAIESLGLPYFVRPSSDYQVSSKALTVLMSKLCGKSAAFKRLPDFWTRLSNASLGVLLRAYFDGDGTVGRGGEVIATTASEQLASDLGYALKRFGIHGRLREMRKRATNSNHSGGTYYGVTISGQGDLRRYAENIGFDHPEKHARLQELLRRAPNTNVDIVPIAGNSLRTLRRGAGLSMMRLAALSQCSHSMLSLTESGQRRPSRGLLLRVLDALAGQRRGDAQPDFAWWKRWADLRAVCGVRWSRIRDVRRIEYPHPYVYDLSVPGPETFLAGRGGAFVHNTFTMANVIDAVQRPTLVLAHNKTLAAQLYGEMRDFFPHNAVEYFVSYYDYYQPEAYVPSSDTYIEKDASVNAHIEQMRLSATKALLERRDTIIVATVSAIYGLGDPQAYLKMVLHLVRGDRIDQRRILRRLAEMQYTRNEIDLGPGTYRVRGEVIDVFPAESEREAIRIQLFDDEIELLTAFDPLTGEVLRETPRFTVYPKTHYVTPREVLLNAIDQIKVELKIRLEALRHANQLVEAQRLEQRTLFDLEMINELGYCAGIENYSRYLSGRDTGEPPPCLFDYLPANALLIVDESHATIPQLGGMYRGDRSRKETLVEYGFRLPSALDNRPLRFDEFEGLSPQTIYVSATPRPYEYEHSAQVVEQVVRPTGLVDPQVEVRPVASQVDDVLSEISICAGRDERVLITTLTKRMAEDLTEYLHEHGVRVRYLHSDIETVERTEIIRDLRLGEFDVLVGINLLREGLDMPEVALVAILDADKEGFLRSEGSLIQTIGRAARNLNGRAIMYADRVTGSMRRAIDETERRRNKQIAFNEAHGITPQTIIKAVADIMEGARAHGRVRGRRIERAAEQPSIYAAMSPEQLMKKLKQLEQRMFRHARDLEFEEAARLRDEIAEIRRAGLGLPDTLAG